MNMMPPATQWQDMSAEQRFAAAVQTYLPGEPEWFVEIAQASSFHDVRGIDFIARIKYPGRRGLVRVPIQIKGSIEQKERYLEKHPEAKAAKVCILIVRSKDKVGTIRSKLYAELGRARSEAREYEPFFKLIGSRRLSRNGRLIQQAIEERRRKENTPRAPFPAPPSLPSPAFGHVPRPMHQRIFAFLRKLVTNTQPAQS